MFSCHLPTAYGTQLTVRHFSLLKLEFAHMDVIQSVTILLRSEMQIMKKALIILSVVFVAVANATVDEDANVWASVNATKKITPDFWMTGRVEYWSREALETTDLWFARIWGTYRILDWMSIGLGYDHTRTESPESSTTRYCQPKNNIFGQATVTVPVSDFRLIFRQRYTRTRSSSCNGKDRDFSNTMRSRITVKYVIPDCPISPFVADEMFYWGKMTQNRSDIGFTFKLTDENSINLFYRRQSKFNPDHRNNNILGIDYMYSF